VGAKKLKDSNKYVEQQIGWWANNHQIVVVKRRREVAPQPNGSFAPVGDWLPPRYAEFKPLTAPDVRTKNVANIMDNEPSYTGGNAGDAQASVFSKQFENALWHIRFLPAEVRNRIIARVPYPTVFEAQAIGWEKPDTPTGGFHRVTALAMDMNRAITVIASMQFGSNTWQVEMTEYQINARTLTNSPRPVLAKAA